MCSESRRTHVLHLGVLVPSAARSCYRKHELQVRREALSRHSDVHESPGVNGAIVGTLEVVPKVVDDAAAGPKHQRSGKGRGRGAEAHGSGRGGGSGRQARSALQLRSRSRSPLSPLRRKETGRPGGEAWQGGGGKRRR